MVSLRREHNLDEPPFLVFGVGEAVGSGEATLYWFNIETRTIWTSIEDDPLTLELVLELPDVVMPRTRLRENLIRLRWGELTDAPPVVVDGADQTVLFIAPAP